MNKDNGKVLVQVDRAFLSRESVARFSREWDKSRGDKNMRLSKTSQGEDRIEISLDGSSTNPAINEMLIQNGEIILESEMTKDLVDKK